MTAKHRVALDRLRQQLEGTDKYIEMPAQGNEQVIRACVEHLRQAYEEFINTSEHQVSYLDGLMACHNFYKMIVLHLVEETGSPYWITAALEIFEYFMQKELKTYEDQQPKTNTQKPATAKTIRPASRPDPGHRRSRQTSRRRRHLAHPRQPKRPDDL